MTMSVQKIKSHAFMLKNVFRCKRIVGVSCCSLLIFIITAYYQSTPLKSSYTNEALNSGRYTKDNRSFIGSSATCVVIVTYMRSGSSLLGDILRQSNDALYVFEPVHVLGTPMMVNKTAEKNLVYVNGTIRRWPFEFRNEAVDIIRNWLLCDIYKLPRDILTYVFMKEGIKTKLARECIFQQTKATRSSKLAFKLCAPKLKTTCENSPTRIIKSIRISLKWTKHLLDEIPSLKIIHLIRDPRATISAQFRFGICNRPEGGVAGCASRFCPLISDDIKEAKKIAVKYPGRFRTVFYEDIARKPVESAENLFNFIGSDFSPRVKEYVYNITHAERNGCGMCTTRSNSSVHVDQWKSKMTSRNINDVEQHCSYVFRQHYYNLTRGV